MSLWIGSGFCSGEGPWSVKDGKLVHLGDTGMGVNRKLVHLGDTGRGVNRKRVDGVLAWFLALQKRLARVRVCSGDWKRICGHTPTVDQGLTGVFLDPPYSAERDAVYSVDDNQVAKEVAAWAIENGDNPMMRIAVCGYEGEHEFPNNWEVYRWKADGGYENQGNGKNNGNRFKETIWFSPHCIKEMKLF